MADFYKSRTTNNIDGQLKNQSIKNGIIKDIKNMINDRKYNKKANIRAIKFQQNNSFNDAEEKVIHNFLKITGWFYLKKMVI